MNDDPLDLIGALAPEHEPDAGMLARTRSTLMHSIHEAETTAETAEDDLIPIDGPSRTRKRRGRRRILPIVAIVAVLTGATGTAWAVFANRDSARTDNLSCPVPSGPDDVAIVSVVTGDPVVDCTNVWESLTNEPAPDMTAYDNGDGAVVVQRADDPAPEGAIALEPGVYQNPDIRRLVSRIADVGVGIDAACHDLATAERMVEGMLDDLGIDGWTVEIDTAVPADREGPCAEAVLKDGAEQRIFIRPLPEKSVFPSPYGTFARNVHEIVDAGCLDLATARNEIGALAAETDVTFDGADGDPVTWNLGDDDMMEFREAPEPSRACTTVTVTVGGGVVVDLIGPATVDR